MIIASNIKDYKATIKEDGLTATLGIVNINGNESSIVLSKYYNYTYSAYNKRLHIVHDSVVLTNGRDEIPAIFIVLIPSFP